MLGLWYNYGRLTNKGHIYCTKNISIALSCHVKHVKLITDIVGTCTLRVLYRGGGGGGVKIIDKNRRLIKNVATYGARFVIHRRNREGGLG